MTVTHEPTCSWASRYWPSLASAATTVLPWFPYVLTVAVVLFAVSTMITWAYYGQKAWTFLFGKNKASERTYHAVFCTFLVVGPVLTLGSVLTFTDAVLFLLALVNIVGLYLLAPVVKRELTEFKAKLASGEVTKLQQTVDSVRQR